ncbi:MAG: TatD family hydrolase [Candidatus Dormibacteria bacterium]
MAEPVLVDAHCHLDEMARRGLAVDVALAQAHLAGVHQVVTSGDGLEDSRQAADLAARHSEVYFTVGWHPVNQRPPSDVEMEELRGLLSHPKAVAVGEIGLDYKFRQGYLETPPALQREMFAMMLALAAELGKPVVIHQRQAQPDLLEVLDRAPAVAGMLHCFSGDAEFAQRACQRGLLVSFAGNLTFKSARDLQQAALVTPAPSLLVETDAPFLAPSPQRGELCHPALVRATASWLAVLRGECLESLARSTTANARAFFHLPDA